MVLRLRPRRGGGQRVDLDPAVGLPRSAPSRLAFKDQLTKKQKGGKDAAKPAEW
jgi:hypothetical protein